MQKSKPSGASHTLKIDPLHMSASEINSACTAWQSGGTLSLGLWLSKYKPHFSVKDYGDLVQLARDELNDTTDYSKEA